MKIEFLETSGDCQFTDGRSSSVPYAGLTYDGMGPAMIATGKTGTATINLDGRRYQLAPNSVVKAENGSGLWRYVSRAGEAVSDGFWLEIGKLWSKIHSGKDWDQNLGSGGGGVRG